MIQQYLNVLIFLGHFGCKLAVYALFNKKMVPWSPLDSFSCHNVHNWHFLHRQHQPQVCFWERFLPWVILCPRPPQVHTFMKHPKFWTTFSTTLWRINDDFGSLPMQGLVKRYNGVKVVARLQTKAYVDRMHALSQLFILIIGKNLTDNSPGYWLSWCKKRIIPCQFSVAWSWKYRSSCQYPEIAAGPNYGVSHNKHHVKSNGLAVLRIVSLDAMWDFCVT